MLRGKNRAYQVVRFSLPGRLYFFSWIITFTNQHNNHVAFYPLGFVRFGDGEFLKKSYFFVSIFFGTPGSTEDVIRQQAYWFTVKLFQYSHPYISGSSPLTIHPVRAREECLKL